MPSIAGSALITITLVPMLMTLFMKGKFYMKSLLETIHTKFPEDSAWNVLWMLSYQCGIEEVQKALNEMKVLFHESGLTQRAPDVCPECFGEKQVTGEDGTVWVCGICGGTGKRR